jgi:hypothetical protein
MELEGSLPCSQEPTLSQLNPVHTLILHFLKIHFNIILSYMPRFPKWFLTFRFSYQNVFTFLPHVCHMTRPSHLPRFHRRHNIRRRVQTTNLLMMRISPSSSYLLALRSNILLSTLFSNTIGYMLFFRETKFHTHMKATSKKL